ncbi:MAG: hypothetical protein WC393_02210 [Candidatus Nanoarchaeia archaeon]|jgi:hypothetical protein
MEKKNYLMIIMAIVIFGIIIPLVYSGILAFINILSPNEEISTSQLLAECGRAASLYTTIKTEVNRKNFCCTSIDLNNNEVIDSNEYCAKIYDKNIEGNSAAILCSSPVNYYSNYLGCENK